MTPPEILDAIASVGSVGASVGLVDGRPRLFGNVDAVPDDARSTLRGRSAELAAYLASAARPAPEWVLLVSKRLKAVELPAAVVDGPTFWRDGEPYYRLTPAVAAWVSAQVDGLRRKAAPDVVAKAGEVAAELWAWVETYYPPHQIRAARLRRPALPEAKEPPSCPGADAWKVRTGGWYAGRV